VTEAPSEVRFEGGLGTRVVASEAATRTRGPRSYLRIGSRATALLCLVAACRAGDSEADPARFSIVGELEPPPEGAFWAPIDLVATPERLWILDVAAAQVYGYAPDGAYQATLGKPGAGPGELKEPLAMGLVGDTLWVLNAGNRRIEYYGVAADSIGPAYGSALGSAPLPDSLPPPLDMVRWGPDWYATSPFLPEPVVRFDTERGRWATFGAEVARTAAELAPRGASIPEAYRLELMEDRLWMLHLYLPVLGIYDRAGRAERVLTYPGGEIGVQDPVEQEVEGRVRRLIRAPRSPTGSLGILRVGSESYVLTRQREENRQRLYQLRGSEVSHRATLMPPEILLVASIQSHGTTYAIGTKGDLEEPSVFVLH
jgi:hypothetical protein